MSSPITVSPYVCVCVCVCVWQASGCAYQALAALLHEGRDGGVWRRVRELCDRVRSGDVLWPKVLQYLRLQRALAVEEYRVLHCVRRQRCETSIMAAYNRMEGLEGTGASQPQSSL